MKKIIRLTESDLTRIVKRVISEQSEPVQSTPNTRYMAVGTKQCFYPSVCMVNIKIIDKDTTTTVISRGSEGEDPAQIYPKVVKMIQDYLTSNKIVGVVIPKFEELEDTSRK